MSLRRIWEFIWGTDKTRKGGDPLPGERALNAARGAGLNFLEIVCRLAVAVVVVTVTVALLFMAGALTAGRQQFSLEQWDWGKQLTGPVTGPFWLSAVGAVLFAALLRFLSSPLARIWILSRDLEFPSTARTEPPVGVPLCLLGRRWPLVVAVASAVLAGVALLIGVVVMSLARLSDWLFVLPWPRSWWMAASRPT